MAGDKISILSPITLLVAADEFAVVDTVAVQTKKITISNLLKKWFQDTDAAGFNLINIQNLVHDLSTTTVALNFNLDELQQISITANTTFTTSNLAIGRSKVVKILNDATLHTLTFPAGWIFVGTKPTDIAASKTGILSLTSFTAVDSGVIASYAVQT